jgi:hypothetical protein
VSVLKEIGAGTNHFAEIGAELCLSWYTLSVYRSVRRPFSSCATEPPKDPVRRSRLKVTRKNAKHQSGDSAVAPTGTEQASSPIARSTPLVFISHDSRDADLAEAFDHLLTDASGGVVQTFRSSDQSGRAGIDYGENWFSKITKMLGNATDVVALLTPSSVDRPWILFEAGFAVGRLDAKVFGIALGLPLSKAVSGPFAQFQNCEATEESLTTVVLKLIQRNPNARPREQAVQKQVGAFLEDIAPLIKQRTGLHEETQEEMNASAVAKLFEEVKVMFRDLPSRVQGELRENGMLRRRRRMHPMMLEEIFHLAHVGEEGGDPSLPWLLLASMFREDIPWVSEASLEVHRAIQTRDPERIEHAQRNLNAVVKLMDRSKFFHRFARDDEESFFMLRHLPELLDRFLEAPPLDLKRRRGRPETQPPPTSELESKK